MFFPSSYNEHIVRDYQLRGVASDAMPVPEKYKEGAAALILR